MWGLELSARQEEREIPRTVQSRFARGSYGVRVAVPYDFKKHWRHEVVIDETGQKIAREMVWLVEVVRVLQIFPPTSFTIVDSAAHCPLNLILRMEWLI